MADSFFYLTAGAHCDSVEVGGGGGGGGGGVDDGLLLSELLQLSTLSGRSGLDISVVVLKKIRACVEQCLGCLQTIV